MTSSEPASLRFTEAISGSCQAETSSARRAGSASIHAPVVTPTGTAAAARTARTVSSTSRSASVSCPAASRGWR